MSNFSINKHGEKDQSDWLTIVHKESDQALIDILSMADGKIANAGVVLDRHEVQKMVDWLEEFLYQTRKGAEK